MVTFHLCRNYNYWYCKLWHKLTAKVLAVTAQMVLIPILFIIKYTSYRWCELEHVSPLLPEKNLHSSGAVLLIMAKFNHRELLLVKALVLILKKAFTFYLEHLFMYQRHLLILRQIYKYTIICYWS